MQQCRGAYSTPNRLDHGMDVVEVVMMVVEISPKHVQVTSVAPETSAVAGVQSKIDPQ
jgi:hypothetical protein